ncbi:MAG: hypothetical protein RLP02_16235 [Coleofasciculus sp. C2-GNP5-27]
MSQYSVNLAYTNPDGNLNSGVTQLKILRVLWAHVGVYGRSSVFMGARRCAPTVSGRKLIYSIKYAMP